VIRRRLTSVKPVMVARIPFILNILILVPVCWSMFFGANGPSVEAFEHRVADSQALRLLVASLWFAILACSVMALWQPQAFTAILVLQVIYKALWLAVFALPVWLSGGVPALGVSLSFAAIVAVWPFFIWRAISG
jgi:hypothetical protein